MKVSIIYHSESGNTEKMAELVKEGCLKVPDIEARCMPIEDIDYNFLDESTTIIFGSPTYEGTCSWQMKKFIDTNVTKFGGKLGGVFVSQNWPGGGGASFAEMSMIAGMLIGGMIIYSSGIDLGEPYLHFGAVSCRAPEDDLYKQRCISLGENLAKKSIELFGNK